MLNENTDYFKYVDNLAKTAHIASVPIFESLYPLTNAPIY